MPDLPADLRALAADLDWPPTPDLAATFRATQGSDPTPARRAPHLRPRTARGLTPWRARRRIVVVLLVAALALPAAAAAVTPVRHAVLDALGLRHVTVERRAVPPPAARRDPHLGTPTSLAGAARAAGFTPRVPARLGAPARVYERDGIVTLVYPGSLLLAQAQGGLPGREILHKVIALDDRAVATTVDGAPALFLRAGHAYAWSDATGPLVRSGPALIWEAGDRVLRLEGERSLSVARRIARSVR